MEVDIQKFFDTLDHAHLRDILHRRVRDGVLLRLIGKWLNAGVLEGLELSWPQAGTPQGGVVSPLLANVYLHEVLDVWFEGEVKPRLHGPATLIRYADDFIIVFSREDDARRVLSVLPKRFGKYGLTLHPTNPHFSRPTESGGVFHAVQVGRQSEQGKNMPVEICHPSHNPEPPIGRCHGDELNSLENALENERGRLVGYGPVVPWNDFFVLCKGLPNLTLQKAPPRTSPPTAP